MDTLAVVSVVAGGLTTTEVEVLTREVEVQVATTCRASITETVKFVRHAALLPVLNLAAYTITPHRLHHILPNITPPQHFCCVASCAYMYWSNVSVLQKYCSSCRLSVTIFKLLQEFISNSKACIDILMCSLSCNADKTLSHMLWFCFQQTNVISVQFYHVILVW